ncbi:MAG: alpha/beta fold hydrolase [Opitutaceae bacterium]
MPYPDPIPWPNDEDELVIGRRFDRVVTLMADRPALCQDGRTWSYRELAEASDRVSGHLQGIQPEGRVMVYLGNSFQHLAVVFGAWKAGWVTIPVDPRYPSERNRLILEDADPHLVITAPHLEAAARELFDRPIDARPIEAYAKTSHGTQRPTVAPDDPSVILYTSGSTGSPKGVLHTHRSIAHMARRRTRILETRPSDAFTLFYSASVMGGLSAVTYALLSGASLHPRNFKAEGFNGLADWLREHRITICHSVTSLFREIINQVAPGQEFPDLRIVVLGGEQAYRRDIEGGRRVFGASKRFLCGLGSTEINSVRVFPIDADTELPTGRIPFGRAVEGVEVILLDPEKRILTPGETGEICIRSRYLSCGYWKKPEMTAERFIPDPEGGGSLLYRTGDLGRLDADGCLHGAGRNDDLVKVRGFRVEPGEVNARLLAQPGIREACTVALTRSSGEVFLAAYYVTDPDQPISGPGLRTRLLAELPDYMVPERLVELEALPRTVNGKIDSKALRTAAPQAEEEAQPAKTRTERNLAELWSEVLDRDSVPVDVGFFDLGGTSLTAIRLLASVERFFQRQIALSILFEHPTIQSLARYLDRSSDRTIRSGLIAVRPDGIGDPLFLVGGMTGEIFFCRQLIRHLKCARPLFALEPDTLSGRRTEHTRIEEVARYYAEIIGRHQPGGPVTLAGYSFGGTVVYELARQLTAAGREVVQTILFDSAPPRLHPSVTPWNSGPSDAPPGPVESRPGPQRPSPLRFFTLKWWMRGRAEWRRWSWRMKYVRLYELMLRLRLSPPVSWRRCYAYWSTHYMGRRYRAKSYPGPIILFRSEARRDQGDQGWRELCGDSLRLIKVPGDHGSIFREPDVRIVARELDKVLDGRWQMADGRWQMVDGRW